MNDLIFHQYDSSPFSEKVRVAFGVKGLTWHAVDQPVIMPKPDLTCLTGGYRKIPVLQIGANIYCDSQIILRELERRFPEPSLLVGGDAGLGFGLGFWADRSIFPAAVPIIFGGLGDQVDEDFKKDREALSGRPFDPQALAKAAPMMAEQLRAHCAILDDQLSDGRAFLLGESAGLADVSAYYNLWFIRSFFAAGAKPIDSLPRIRAWEKRVQALGHGKRLEMEPAEAVALAKAASPKIPASVNPAGEPNGLALGQSVRVMADDYGRDPIEGTVAVLSPHEIAIERSDERVGEVVVHFPRAGFTVLPV